jgi:hypothetical protein
MQREKLTKFFAAAVIYAGFAVYLYQPYFQNLKRWQWFLPINLCLACLGCYLLSRRWISTFIGSFFAGATYGFGPFILGLTKFHPAASLLAASIPWLFCPAAFVGKTRWRWLSVPLSVLPFLGIFSAFQLFVYYRLFLIPISTTVHTADLLSLIAPFITAGRTTLLIGFYHISLAALAMGLVMLLKVRRLGIIVIFSAGLFLSLCGHLFSLDVSPIIWLAVPILCCSILIGVGMQGLVCAGYADRNWVLFATGIMTVLAIVALLLATKYFQVFLDRAVEYAPAFDGFTETAKMYILGAIALAIIFFMTRAKLRLHWLRWTILCSAMAIDIFFGARFIVDRIL